MTKWTTTVLILTFLGYNQTTGSSNSTNNSVDTASVIPQQTDNSKNTQSDNFYKFVPATDSTSIIVWGNKTIENKSKTHFDNQLLDDRIYLKWENEKYIALDRSTGSDTWFTIILPLQTGKEELIFQNPLAVDKGNGLIVYENYIESDTVLIVENFDTRKRQFIGMNWKKCGAASFIHYCIDSINLANKELYVEWTLPHKIEKQHIKEIKRIKIAI